LQAKVLGALNHHRLREKAIALLDALNQKNVLTPEDRFFLARLLVQHQGSADWVKARALLKTLILEQPKNVRYLAYAAQQHVQQREYAEAEPIIAKLEAVERERKTTEGGFGSIELRAKILEQRGLGIQAAALLSKYAEQPGAAPTRKLLLANLHGRLGNFREAINWCEEVRQTGTHPGEANATAVAILRMNKPSEAQPTKFDQWQKQRERVEEVLREAMNKDAKDSTARLHLADLMELQGKYDEVEQLCREVLKQNEDHLVALNNLAWLLGQRTTTATEALALIDRAIAKHGQRPELLDTRAVALLNLGRIEAALRDLERVVNEAPTPTRLFHLCRAYERSQNIASAQATLRQANESGLTSQHLHPIEQAEYQRVAAALAKRQ
jgi:tetratricopeptide (TPR) repeat protein